jgi:xanthine/uracil permease
MTAVGMALVFGGYTILLYGWILVKGYDISFTSLFNHQPWPEQSKSGA